MSDRTRDRRRTRRRAPREWDVVVVGSAGTDFVVRGFTLPTAGEAEEGETFLQTVGGKGANLAVAAARVGARVAFVGCVGADARGDQVLERLQGEGVDVRHVVRDPDAPTAAVVIQVDERGRTQSVRAAGAAAQLSWADVARARGLLQSARIVACVRTLPDAVLVAAATLARSEGAEVYLDVAWPGPISDELLRLSDVCRANAREAEAVTRTRVEDERSARVAAAALTARGARVAVVSAPDGNGVLAPAGWSWLPTLAVDVVDTTGAGDAFGGVLASELARGALLEEAVAMGHAAAALTTTRLGGMPSLPQREEITELCRKLAASVA